ncbi:hypothetical protein QQF64_010894 [Cirrhinus molitorella]|uniref:Uncharacterized protein n=1 Tax=Cirrhinus molitorella TaxID=172907 RepID=A0ABR3LZB3_9TELE
MNQFKSMIRSNQTYKRRASPVLGVSEVVWACTENPANINQVVFPRTFPSHFPPPSCAGETFLCVTRNPSNFTGTMREPNTSISSDLDP